MEQSFLLQPIGPTATPTQTLTPPLIPDLSNPAWEGIGAITGGLLGLAALILAFGLWWVPRHRKALSYQVMSITPLLRHREEVADRLQILFEGKAVQDVHLVLLRIANSGDEPITEHDYARDLTLRFGDNATVLSAQVIDQDPPNLGASATIERQMSVTEAPDPNLVRSIEISQVRLNNVLLNGGDSYKVKALVTRPAKQVTLEGRVVGVRTIRQLTGREADFRLQLRRIALAIGIAGGVLLVWALLLQMFIPFYIVLLVLLPVLVNVLADLAASNRYALRDIVYGGNTKGGDDEDLDLA